MKLPRNLSGPDVVKGLAKLGYTVTRQKGSHVRLTCQRNGEHHVTVPNHGRLRIGTLVEILKDVAEHLILDRDTLLEEMFG